MNQISRFPSFQFIPRCQLNSILLSFTFFLHRIHYFKQQITLIKFTWLAVPRFLGARTAVRTIARTVRYFIQSTPLKSTVLILGAGPVLGQGQGSILLLPVCLSEGVMLVVVPGKAVAVAVVVAVALAQLEIKSSEMSLPHHLPLPLLLILPPPPHHHHHRHHHHHHHPPHHHHHHPHPHLLPRPVNIRMPGCFRAPLLSLNASAPPAPAHLALDICQTLTMKTTMTMKMTMRMRMKMRKECVSFMKGSRNVLCLDWNCCLIVVQSASRGTPSCLVVKQNLSSIILNKWEIKDFIQIYYKSSNQLKCCAWHDI